MKQTKGSRTKKHIFQCALELFRTKGYENVSVDEIVKKAGTAKGTFYVHFPSKVDIITEMLCEYDHYYDKVRYELSDNLSIEEKIDEIIKAACHFTEHIIGVDLLKILYSQQLCSKEQTPTLLNNRSLHRMLLDFLEEEKLNGELETSLDTEYVARLMVQAIRGSFFEWCIQNGKYDLYKECQYMVSLICKEIRQNKATEQ